MLPFVLAKRPKSHIVLKRDLEAEVLILETKIILSAGEDEPAVFSSRLSGHFLLKQSS